MLEGLFGNSVVERNLFTLLVYGETCPFSLAKTYDEPVNRFQQQLKRPEDAGIVTNRRIGRTRTYTVNPRYPFRGQLTALVAKAFEFAPEKEKEACYWRRICRPHQTMRRNRGGDRRHTPGQRR
jgi:hypothetical protein